MDILGPDRGKMTIYGSDFQQENLTPNRGVSPTDHEKLFFIYSLANNEAADQLAHNLNLITKFLVKTLLPGLYDSFFLSRIASAANHAGLHLLSWKNQRKGFL